MIRHVPAMVLCVLILEASAWGKTRVGGEVTVVVLEQAGQEPRRAFVQALRIQLADLAAVVEGGRVAEGTLAARVEEAAAAVAQAGGTFALWLDQAGGGDFVLHVVGRRAGRAIVEIVRMPAAADGPETDRALAIKARDVIEEILAPAATAAPDAAVALARALRPSAPPARAALAYTVEVGAVGAGGPSRPRGGLALAAALRLDGAAGMTFELHGAARFVSDITAADERGAITVGEQSAAIGIRLLAAGRVGVGGAVELGARWLHAEGTTSAGTTGTTSNAVPTVAAGPALRLPLRPGVELRAAVVAEVALWRQRFALNGEPFLDLGRVRPLGTASLLVVFP
jgi:hypothetical protein